MKFTFNGHACFSLEVGGKKLIIDPFLTSNPANAGRLKADDVEADYILLTHAHFDHVEDALSIAKRTNAQVVCNYDMTAWFIKNGYENVAYMNIGGTLNLDVLKVKLVQALHSSVYPDGTYGGTAGGFILESGNERVYLSGDTAVFGDMALFKRLYQPTKAIMSIGGVFTMDYQDATVAAELLGVKEVIGCHFDSFPPIQIDHDAATKAFDQAGQKLILAEPGSSFSF